VWRGSLIGLLAGAIAWTDSAHAADYGGGNTPASVRSAHRSLVLVGVRTAADGTAQVRVVVQARCGSGETTRRLPLAPDGSFSLAATVRDRAREDRRVRRTARFSVAGRVAGAAGSGTASVRLTFRRGGRVRARCSSGTRAWHVRAAGAEPAGAAARPNGAYYGLTSQAERRIRPFTLRVDPRGRRVRVAIFEYRQRCGSGPREWSNVTPGARIRPDGTFRLRERFVYRYRNANERFVVRMDGRFTPNGVSGAFSVSATARALRGGRVLGRCSTGPQSFAAAL
jgi:hypothetical protein